MTNNKLSIDNILRSLESLEATKENFLDIANCLNGAKGKLLDAYNYLENVPVKGKDAMDVLLGCMLAIELIIGKEGE